MPLAKDREFYIYIFYIIVYTHYQKETTLCHVSQKINYIYRIMISKEEKWRTASVEVSMPAPPTVSEKAGCLNACSLRMPILGASPTPPQMTDL